MTRWLMVTMMISAAAAVACSGDADGPSTSPRPGVGTGAGAGAGATTAPSGLPCDVQDVLQQHCLACHGATPASGAPSSLATLTDLMEPSLADPALNRAEASLLRMMDDAAPMPPAAPPPAEDVAVFSAWIDAGMPEGTCDGGGGVEPVPLTCSSDSYWLDGDEGGREMHPGMACVSCHINAGKGPNLLLGGTVYPTAHEPDDCNGVSDVAVEVTDANGMVYTLTTNAAGNFFVEGDEEDLLATPITARIIRDGVVREMEMAVDTGDCNQCHSEQGANGAAGRLVAP